MEDSDFRYFLSGLTLTLHTSVEEERARLRQMWLRTGSTVREVLPEPSTLPQMECYRASSAVFTGVGMQR